MLWSLIKILIFLGATAALAFGALSLMQAEGGLRLAVGGWEFNPGPLQTVIAGILLLLGIWVFFKLVGLLIAVIRFLTGDETALSRYFDRNRERRGYEALADGITALASGEPKLAMAKAARAERYLARPELTNLISAQAADAAGDGRRAETMYKRLLGDPRTRFVGIRGLLKQRLASGDRETALKLAEKAFELKPGHVETQDLLLQLQSETGDWQGARNTLGSKLRLGALPKAVHKRRDAVLALQQARAVLDADSPIEAREAAIAANKASPDLIPAAVMAARGYIADGKPKLAVRVLKKAWEARPHPDLAAVWAEIEPDETPAERVKRFRQLVAANPADAESHMLMAELLIAAEDFPEARRSLAPVMEGSPTARALTLMAAIERGQGESDDVVRGWLARAISAPRGPQWVCDNCGHVHADWGPLCEQCGAFDSLSWKAPAETPRTGTAAGDMLPLLVSSPEEEGAETAEFTYDTPDGEDEK